MRAYRTATKQIKTATSPNQTYKLAFVNCGFLVKF